MDDDKITIIEGPPPTFESIREAWALGLNESPYLSDVAITRLRTFNGASLIERCHRAWRKQGTIHLEYRDMDGLQNTTPILAARSLDVEDGQLLILWVRVESEEEEAVDAFDDGEPGEDDLDFPEM